jgi:AbrB family looped-hinge helix DNA binding protein
VHYQIARLSSKGQFVIPENVRKMLGLRPGSKRALFTDGEHILLKPVPTPDVSAFRTSENPQQSGFFSTVEENESPFIPILSADVSAVASSGEVFRSRGSKTDPVLHVRFPRPWSVVAENRSISNWRRG